MEQRWSARLRPTVGHYHHNLGQTSAESIHLSPLHWLYIRASKYIEFLKHKSPTGIYIKEKNILLPICDKKCLQAIHVFDRALVIVVI